MLRLSFPTAITFLSLSLFAVGCGGDPPGETGGDAASDGPIYGPDAGDAHARHDASDGAPDVDGGADADASRADATIEAGGGPIDASVDAPHDAAIDAHDGGGGEDASDAETDAGFDAGDPSDAEADAFDPSDASDASDAAIEADVDAGELVDASDAAIDAADADVTDAACGGDSGPSTCGWNGRGTTKAVCDDGGWDVTCTDPDECADGTARHGACGINARGTSTQTCASGHWGATSCVDVDECADGAQTHAACGINNRGASTRTCAGGHWGAATSCVDPDVCQDGARTPGTGACGFNGRGTIASTCVSGQWGVAACVDPDFCQDGAQRTMSGTLFSCGLNRNGKRTSTCVAGKWSTYVCVDPDECTNGATSQLACGLNNRGSAPRTCTSGHWASKACVDPDQCVDGAQTHGTCGLNNRGTSTTICTSGHLGSPSCADTDACVDGAQTHATCGLNNRGTSTTTCTGGQLGSPVCADADECVDGAKSQRACALDASGTAQTTCAGGKWQASTCVCPAGEQYTCGDRCVLPHPRAYVTSKALACEDGLSWATAFSSLPRALGAVMDHGEVWIAQGVYVTSAASPTFTLDRAVSIYGGFTGNETLISQRDSAHTTTLQRGADVTAIPSQGSSILAVRAPIDVLLDGFSVVDGAATRGAGLSISNGQVTAHNVAFAFNRAQIEGGAIYVADPGALTIDHATFDSNQGGGGGGAVSAGSTATFVRDSIFTTNSAMSGGAITSVRSVERSTFTGNVAQSGDTGAPNHTPIGGVGGAIDAGFFVTISDSVFEQNKATLHGGAVHGQATLLRTAFRRNSAGSIGGAVAAYLGEVQFCDFVENTANYGSAVAPMGSRGAISSSTFVGNVASQGGAVAASETSLTLTNVLFAKNQGGALSLSDFGTYAIAQATFVDNTSTLPGAAIDVSGSSNVEIDNSLFARNTAPSARHVNAGAGAKVVVRGSCLEGEAWTGTGDSNISSAPIFESATSYVPSASSPTVDAALLAAVPADADDVDGDGNVVEPLPFDLVRNPRVVRAPDMGAYERP